MNKKTRNDLAAYLHNVADDYLISYRQFKAAGDMSKARLAMVQGELAFRYADALADPAGHIAVEE